MSSFTSSFLDLFVLSGFLGIVVESIKFIKSDSLGKGKENRHFKHVVLSIAF